MNRLCKKELDSLTALQRSRHACSWGDQNPTNEARRLGVSFSSLRPASRFRDRAKILLQCSFALKSYSGELGSHSGGTAFRPVEGQQVASAFWLVPVAL